MTRILFTVVVLLYFGVDGYAKTDSFLLRKDRDTLVAQRGWVVRAAYNRQEVTNWAEIGFGRMSRLHYFDQFGSGSTYAAASFTFGADATYDTSLLIAPKLSVEVSCIFLGARVNYGYYMREGNAAGVIGLEGGFNILSVFFAYAGYNFVKGNSDDGIMNSGPRFSVGFNFPLCMQRVPEPKRSTHL